jgi:hypothetical protein
VENDLEEERSCEESSARSRGDEAAVATELLELDSSAQQSCKDCVGSRGGIVAGYLAGEGEE